jgi:hypothetical protein
MSTHRLEIDGQLVAELDPHEVLMLQNLISSGFKAKLAAPIMGTHSRPEHMPTSAVTAVQIEHIDVTMQLRFVRERTVSYDAHPSERRRS